MENRRILFTLMLLTIGTALFAQAPGAFKYQAVARTGSGGLITDQNIGIRIGILKGNQSNTMVYSETHSPETNQYGLFSLMIGNGILESGSFGSIDWSEGPYFIKIEVDENGGTDWQVMDTTQLVSVPYAMYSGSTGDTSRWRKSNDTLYYNKGYIGIGTASPDEALDVTGNIKVSGTLQLGTTAGIAINDTCTAAEAGMIIFNGTHFCACDGTSWKKVD